MMRRSYWSYRVGGLLLMTYPWIGMAQAPESGAGATPPAVELPVIQAATPVSAPDNASSTTSSAENAPPSVNTASPLSQPSKYSYGDALYSLLFTADQIEAMKSALRTYESVQPTDRGTGEVAVTVSAAPQAPTLYEPAMYPVFYLSSIAYRSPHDWTVWVKESPSLGGSPAPALPTAAPSATGNFVPPSPPPAVPTTNATSPKNDPSLIRITPKFNNRDLKVVHISANQVEFSWHPSAYTQALTMRYSKKLFNPIDAVKHRSALNSSASFDTKTQTVHFSLKQNQSFASAYSQCFEGNIDPAPLAPLSGANATAAANIPMTPQAASDINGLLGQPAATNTPVNPGTPSATAVQQPSSNPAGKVAGSPFTSPAPAMMMPTASSPTSAPAMPATATPAPAPTPTATRP